MADEITQRTLHPKYSQLCATLGDLHVQRRKARDAADRAADDAATFGARIESLLQELISIDGAVPFADQVAQAVRAETQPPPDADKAPA